MWKELKVSLYDLFGYFFPGAILLIAITMTIPWSAKADTWAVLILTAYLAGHVVQAVANLIFPSRPRIKACMASIPRAVLGSVDNELEAFFPKKVESVKDLSPYDKFLLCDEVISQKGRTENKDIYVYREGFYKGLTVSFFLFFIGLSYWMPAQELLVNLGQKSISFPFHVLVTLQLSALVVSFLFYRRYVRFSQYKTNETFYGFLTVMRIQKEEK